jgi:pyrimidine operon attenuation protein/uracil phosphoribosyltransferase
VGRVVPTSRDESIEVFVKELDGKDEIVIVAKE